MRLSIGRLTAAVEPAAGASATHGDTDAARLRQRTSAIRHGDKSKRGLVAGLCSLQANGLTNLRATKSTIDHFVEKAQKIGEIEPEAAIQASGIETAIQQRIVPLDHHISIAFQAVHESVMRPFVRSFVQSVVNVLQASTVRPAFCQEKCRLIGAGSE